MFARNPFEAALNSGAPATDVQRTPPRDLMADAFLSELLSRLDDASRYGYRPGVVPNRFPYGRDYEHNGFPTDHGLRGTHHTYPAISSHPISLNPFDLGSRGQAFGAYGGEQEVYDGSVPGEYSGESEFGEDPFAPSFDEGMDQFALDALPYAGSDGMASQTPDPFTMAQQPALPSFPPYRPDPNLDALRKALRPGYAKLSTFGYSEPNTDPYAQDLTALLRRLVRQA